MALFYAIPLLFVVSISFFAFRDFAFVPELSLANYITVFTTESFRPVFLRTIVIATVTTILVVVIAYVITYLVNYRYRRYRQLFLFLVLVNLFGGYLVRIYAWRTILGQEGIINGFLLGSGLVTEPVRWILNSPFAIMIALVNFLIALAVLPIHASMQNVQPTLVESARDLGSSTLDLNRRVMLPLVMPGVRVAMIFSFIATASEFGVPSLLGGTGSQMAGNLVQFQMAQLNWPLASALAIVLVACAIGLALTLASAIRLLTR
jgi:spermidine/putrescine transport system permease protein